MGIVNKNLKKFLNIVKKFNIIQDEDGAKLNIANIIHRIERKENFNLLLAKF